LAECFAFAVTKIVAPKDNSLSFQKELSHFKKNSLISKRKGVNLYSSRLFKISIPKGSKTPIENRVLQGRVKATA
jgi:hypothetical protein